MKEQSEAVQLPERLRTIKETSAFLGVPGANVKAVQPMLEHASAAMTLDVYAGLFGDDLDTVADRLDEAAAPACADYLRTELSSEAVLPFDLDGRTASGPALTLCREGGARTHDPRIMSPLL